MVSMYTDVYGVYTLWYKLIPWSCVRLPDPITGGEIILMSSRTCNLFTLPFLFVSSSLISFGSPWSPASFSLPFQLIKQTSTQHHFNKLHPPFTIPTSCRTHLCSCRIIIHNTSQPFVARWKKNFRSQL